MKCFPWPVLTTSGGAVFCWAASALIAFAQLDPRQTILPSKSLWLTEQGFFLYDCFQIFQMFDYCCVACGPDGWRYPSGCGILHGWLMLDDWWWLLEQLQWQASCDCIE